MKPHFKLLGFLSLVLLVIVWGVVAMTGSVAFFLKPSEVQDKHIGKRLRIGGMVASFHKENFPYKFVLEDPNASIQVIYQGVLPDLFRKEQMVVVEGVLQQGQVLWADMVLAKHDEEYIPYGMK